MKSMETNEIKALLLNYYRFTKGIHLIATEVWDGCSYADILYITKSSTVEIEIKITKSDLKNDNKKGLHRYCPGASLESPHRFFNSKHSILSEYSPYYKTPNKFYYAVPNNASLIEYANSFILNLNPSYGLISVSTNRYYPDAITVIRKAYSLHPNDVTDKYRQSIYERNINDLCSKYRKLYLKKAQ